MVCGGTFLLEAFGNYMIECGILVVLIFIALYKFTSLTIFWGIVSSYIISVVLVLILRNSTKWDKFMRIPTDLFSKIPDPICKWLSLIIVPIAFLGLPVAIVKLSHPPKSSGEGEPWVPPNPPPSAPLPTV
jgi:hypothetical protein